MFRDDIFLIKKYVSVRVLLSWALFIYLFILCCNLVAETRTKVLCAVHFAQEILYILLPHLFKP